MAEPCDTCLNQSCVCRYCQGKKPGSITRKKSITKEETEVWDNFTYLCTSCSYEKIIASKKCDNYTTKEIEGVADVI